MNHNPTPSYRRVFKVMSFLATTSVISVLFGLLRMKVAAVLLGPIGVGVIGLLQNASGIATTLGDMGMRQSGAREIAKFRSADNAEGLDQVGQTLAWMALGLSLIVSLPIFVFRDEIALRLLDEPSLSDDIGWLTVVIVATICAAALTAILNGRQRVREIGRITVMSAAASCIVSVGAMWIWQEGAIPIVVAAAPVMLFSYSLWYVVRISALPKWTFPTILHAKISIRLMKLGVFVMLSALTLSASEFLVRINIQHEMGAVKVGLFAAAWTVGIYYLNFLMVATSTEFFPRLCSQIENIEARDNSINVQLQSMVVASTPIFIIISSLCPIVLSLLFSEDFLGASSLLRIMIVGDVFRLAIYPLGFVLLAAAHGKTYFLLKLFEAISFASLSAILVPGLGLSGVGAAHVATFGMLFLLYLVVLGHHLRFRLDSRSLSAVGCLAAIAIALSGLAIVNEFLARLAGGILGMAWLIIVLRIRQASKPEEVR